VVLAVVVAVAVAVYAPYLVNAIAPSLTTGTAAAGTLAIKGIAGYALAGGIAGGLSGLITTGSLSGLLKGAALGALTGAVAGGFEVGGGVFEKLRSIGGNTLKAAKALTHGVIGGIRAKINGGSFGTGFLTGGLGKLATFATNAIDNIYVQGLAVATAGGLVSQLAGGSFEAGFITAGIAFAANRGLTELDKKSVDRKYNKLKDRVLEEAASDRDAKIKLTVDDVKLIAKYMYNRGVGIRQSGTDYVEAMARDADTFLRFDGLPTRVFEIGDASGIVGFGVSGNEFLGGQINYIGVGAFNTAFGVPWVASITFVNDLQNLAWNVGQYTGFLENGTGFLKAQNLKNIPGNSRWFDFGSFYAN